MKKALKYSISSVVLASMLSACGGGGGGGGEAPFVPKEVKGKAVDFYLKDATVVFDDCKDAQNNPIFAITDANGNFSYSTTENCQKSSLTITGGIDIVTGLNFTGTLKIKETDLQNLGSNAFVVSPLTTLQTYLTASTNSKTVLTNLGLSAETISQLERNNFDLSRFDPVVDGTAKDMAVVFLVQQLANQIEDNLQKISNSDASTAFDADQATQMAFQAIISQTATQALFTGDTVKIDAAILTAIVENAVQQAVAQAPEAVIDTDSLALVAESITNVSTKLDTIVETGGTGQSLTASIANDNSPGGIKDTITENLQSPVYSDFNLANYSVSQLKDSTSTNPLNLSLTNINSLLAVKLNLKATNSALTDNTKLAFKIIGKRGAVQETLNASIGNIKINFDASGNIISAIIPAGTDVYFTSSLRGVTTSQIKTLNSINIQAQNGAISLQQLIQVNAALQGYYNTYINTLAANDTVEVTAFVLPSAYTIDSSLALSKGTVDFGADNYLGSTLTAHFKLN